MSETIRSPLVCKLVSTAENRVSRSRTWCSTWFARTASYFSLGCHSLKSAQMGIDAGVQTFPCRHCPLPRSQHLTVQIEAIDFDLAFMCTRVQQALDKPHFRVAISGSNTEKPPRPPIGALVRAPQIRQKKMIRAGISEACQLRQDVSIQPVETNSRKVVNLAVIRKVAAFRFRAGRIRLCYSDEIACFIGLLVCTKPERQYQVIVSMPVPAWKRFSSLPSCISITDTDPSP